MKYLCFLVFLFYAAGLASQSDYHFFQPDQQYLFENESTFVDETNSRMVGIKIGEDECAELYKTIVVERLPSSPFTSDNHLVVPSFAGLSICQMPDSILMDVGKENDVVILQQAGLGERWDVTVEDGILVTGRVDSIREIEIDGILDSVKFINFFNGDTLLLDRPVELSKANGLLQGAYFWSLLTMSETLERMDTGGAQFPGWDEFHSFAVGDEYHVESFEWQLDTSHQFNYFFEQEIFRVLSVSNIEGYRHVEYSSDLLTYSTTDYEGRSDARDSVLYLNRTIRHGYEINSPNWVNYQPGAVTGVVQFFGLASVVQVRGSCFGSGKTGAYPHEPAPLYSNAGYWFDLGPVETFISGHGGGYFMFYDQEGGVSGRNLVYSNKAGAGCSTGPFDFSGITEVEYVDDVPGVSVFPNPASEIINIISTVEMISTVSLYNSTGKMVLSQKIDPDSIDIGSFPAGVYYLVLHFRNGKKLNKRIVVL